MNEDWDNNQEPDEEEELFEIEIDPLNSLLFLLTDLLYDAAKTVICWGIWEVALVRWFDFLPTMSYWQMFMIVLFFNVLLAGRLNE